MDTSKRYIEMCEKAQEVQDLQHFPKIEDWQKLDELDEYFLSFECGDFIAYNSNDTENWINIWVFGDITHEREIKTIKCWLPRQDQLQDMIEGTLINKIEKFNQFINPPYLFIKTLYDEGLLSEFKNNWYKCLSKVDNSVRISIIESKDEVEIINISTETFKSFEQLWLSFIMKEKYNKVWDNKIEEWKSIN